MTTEQVQEPEEPEESQEAQEDQEADAQVEGQAEDRAREPVSEGIKLTISYTPSRTVVGAQVAGCDPVLMVFSSPPPTFREALDQPLNEVVRRATELARSQRQYPAYKAPPAPRPPQPGPAAPRPATTPGQPAAKASKEGAQTGLFG